MYSLLLCVFFFSSRRRHTRCALVTGVQTCALPISRAGTALGLFAVPFDIVAGRPPYRLATGVEKAKPHHDIIGVGAKRMTRADPRQRQIEKEAIQIGKIGRASWRERVCQ